MAIKMFDGNGAAVESIRLARPGVIAAYPITPPELCGGASGG